MLAEVTFVQTNRSPVNTPVGWYWCEHKALQQYQSQQVLPEQLPHEGLSKQSAGKFYHPCDAGKYRASLQPWQGH